MNRHRIEPRPGQESVWDYPRPPRLEPASKHIQVRFGGEVIADTRRALRILETSHPPTYYLPPEDVRGEFLIANPRQSFCEWKGSARYFDLEVGEAYASAAVWSYPRPSSRYPELQDYLAFYPSRVEAFVEGERVRAQEGDFYGGWITDAIVGPFKGAPGTFGW